MTNCPHCNKPIVIVLSKTVDGAMDIKIPKNKQKKQTKNEGIKK